VAGKPISKDDDLWLQILKTKTCALLAQKLHKQTSAYCTKSKQNITW